MFYCVKLGWWIHVLRERREVVNEIRRIKREKLREHQNTEGNVRCLECKKVEWNV